MSPTEAPTHRAIFTDRRLFVVPWERARRAARLNGVGRGDAPPAFDIWRRGSDCLARQHGTAEASAEIARLSRWAEETGSHLTVGSPLGCRRPYEEV
jgi:hypothetical protein